MVKRKIDDFFIKTSPKPKAEKKDEVDIENTKVADENINNNSKKRKLKTTLKPVPVPTAAEVEVKIEAETETKVARPQRVTRSLRNRNPVDYSKQLSADISPEKPKEEKFPGIKYKGDIRYATEMADIASACEELLEFVKSQPDVEKIPIAFDMEWPFSFKTGPGKSAVIQMCADEKLCYVLHIFELKKLPVVLLELLEHPKVCLHGVNIKNDFRKLQRDFPEANADTMISHCVDLGPWCNAVCNTSGRWSMERLVKYICKLQIDKNKEVRMSKWHVMPLNDAQKLYAAIDVYISQVIYRELERREAKRNEEEEKFLNEHGEKALKAVKALL